MKCSAKLAAGGLFLLSAACFCLPAFADSGTVGTGANWTNHDGDIDATSYSRLDQISTGDIGKLGLAWSMNLPGQTTLEATPVAVDGVLYFTGTYGEVFAVDGATGKTLWTYDPQTWKYDPHKLQCSFAANRGVAYDNGKIFSAALDGRLFALDAKTGKVLWTVQTVAKDNYQYITGAPAVFDNEVIIGQGGADFSQRGYVTAYDQATGKQLWRFYVTPGSPAENKGNAAMEKAAKTWGDDYWKIGGGGGDPWDSLTFDPELNQVYIATANASPYDPAIRSPGGGSNLYTASIVALDAKTGQFLWDYQVVPDDAWDYDATQQMTLATLDIGGKPVPVLMQAPKDGFFYVIDRKTGKLLSAAEIGRVTWATGIDMKTGRPIVNPKAIYYPKGVGTLWPAPMGAHSWMAMSYDPQTGLVYIPYMQLGLRETAGVPQPKGFQVGPVNIMSLVRYKHDDQGALLAWNPATQQPAWKDWHPYIWNGGVLSTAGGLVFQGTADGHFAAYDAKTGKQLWQQNAGGGVIAAPMTFEAGGKQYVAVLAGYGGSTAAWGARMNVGWAWGDPRRLLVFALGGNAAPLTNPPLDTTIHAVDDPSLKLDPAEVTAGHALFVRCVACHGLNLISTGSPAPDLRASRIAVNPAAFYDVVHNGAFLQFGMPKFDELSQAQITDLYQYIRAGARAAIKAEKTANK